MNNNQSPSWPGWETVKLIGRGSFGAVYEIQRDMLGDIEKAALKVISIPQNNGDIEELYNDGYDDESITSTFQSHLKSIIAEYTLMRKMNGCTNIVNCDDVRYVQHDDGIGWDIFIKMELLQPITKALPAAIPEETVLKIARDMCNALVLCKKYDIVHRDIKPQNIFVSPNGDFKLGDFGIAKTVEKTMGGTKIGTYKYMAPEVYNNQPYGSAADIYSLGLVLYWLLNERRMPFLPLPPAKMSAGMDEEARHLRLSGKQIPPPAYGNEALKRIVLKACAYDVKDRYASVYEMMADLKQLGIEDFEDVTEIAPQEDLTVRIFPQNPPVEPSDDPPVSVEPPVEPPVDPPADPPKSPKKPLIISLIAGLAAVLVIVLLLLRGCDTQANVPDPTDGTSEVQATEEVFEMALNTDRLSVFADDTAILEVSGIPEDAKVKWSSSDKSVAKVNSDGEVTGIGEGVATITATWKHDGETYTVSAEVTVVMSGITLSDYTIDSFFVGETRTLTATTSPEGGNVVWTSGDAGVATVSENGVVTAVGEGSTTITASFGNYTETCNVQVTVPSISLSKTNATLYVGDSTTVAASTLPGSMTVSWSSDNSGVATVSGGKITAVSAGTTTIRATMSYAGKSYAATCTVSVTQPSVTLSKTAVSLISGDSTTLTASTTPGGCAISWSSSNAGVATVSNGNVKAVSVGTAQITAQITYAGKTYKASCTVTVADPSVVISTSSNVITFSEIENGTCTLTANVTPDGGTVAWSSDNSAVAPVSGNGTTATVKALSEGSATITATYTVKGKTVKDSCTITVQKAASTLSLTGLSYPGSGTVDSFTISGTLSSNYALVRAECTGSATSNALGISVSDTASPFYFGEGVYTADMSILTSYFIEQYRSLYNLYSAAAGLLGADNSVTMNVTGTCYDTSGNHISFAFTYVIYS